MDKKEKRNSDQLNSKNFFDQLVKYLPLYAAIPILLGSFYQSYNLISINIGFLRFFSTSQLISDGLAMLLPTIFLAFISTIIIILFSDENKAFLFGFIFFYYIIDISKLLTSEHPLFQNIRFWILLIVTILIITLFILMAFKDYFVGVFFITLAVMGFLSFIYIAGLIFYYTIATSSDSLGLNKLENLKNVECLVNQNLNEANPEIKYFNDKYIFVEFGKNDQRKIRIFPFEEFYNFKSCDE